MANLQSSVMVFLAHLILLLGIPTALVGAVPVTPNSNELAVSKQAGSSYWVADIKRQGAVAFGGSSNYQIFRNVKDFGAMGELGFLKHWYPQNGTNADIDLQVTAQPMIPLPSTRPLLLVTAVAKAVTPQPPPPPWYTSRLGPTSFPSPLSSTTTPRSSVMSRTYLSSRPRPASKGWPSLTPIPTRTTAATGTPTRIISSAPFATWSST